jgi:hypothetical protein
MNGGQISVSQLNPLLGGMVAWYCTLGKPLVGVVVEVYRDGDLLEVADALRPAASDVEVAEVHGEDADDDEEQ